METKKVLCPKCGRKVMEHWKGAHNVLHVRCRKCKRVVAVNTETGLAWIDGRVCERQTSSGVRFF